MPIARYFIFVGSTLAALLFIPGWLLPNAPAAFADQSVGRDRAVLRIKSPTNGRRKSFWTPVSDHHTSRCHGPSADPVVDSASV